MNNEDIRARLKSIVLILFFITYGLSIGTGQAGTVDKAYYHIPILTDPHLPGKDIDSMEQVIQTINSWDDVDMVISLGDVCQDRGTDDEYASVKQFFGKLKKPLYPIVGNHDYIYATALSPKGKRIKAKPAERKAKLLKFKETFGLKTIFYSKEVGNYLLVFLSTDHLAGELTEISEQQLDWLRLELGKNNKKPTIIFFHAPLQGTLRSYNSKINTPSRIAQPAEKIHDILAENPQVFLWVSGHTHTSPQEESFASGINVYEKRITNIHNTNLDRETILTNSLFLYPAKIIVKTYNHNRGAWLPDFDRIIMPPMFK